MPSDVPTVAEVIAIMNVLDEQIDQLTAAQTALVAAMRCARRELERALPRPWDHKRRAARDVAPYLRNVALVLDAALEQVEGKDGD
jgi:hypothetical protein